MKDKKHIDKLFKERFKNFEVTPSSQVWNKIQAKMKAEEEDRKVIPLWIKLGGIAALLAVILTVGNFVINTSNKNITPVITEEKIDAKSPNTENNILPKENEINKIEIASEDPEDKNLTKDSLKETSVENEINPDPNKNVIKNSSKDSETVVANKNVIKKELDDNRSKNNIKKDPINKTSKVDEAIADQEVIDKTSDLPTKEEREINESLINKDKAISNITDKEAVASEKNDKIDSSKKISENEEIEVSKTEEEKKRSIFDAINEEEEAVVTVNNDPDNRWNVTPNVGPVYYSSLNGGSSLDPSFSDNPKSSDLNISYGVQVSYNLNNRVSVRSGISNVNLSYVTTGVELGTGPVSSALKSVDYGNKSIVTIVVDKGTLNSQNPDNGEFGNITPKSTSGEVSLNQKIRYYEVPLELSYALVNKKFGVNLIGGFSTLLLGDSEVAVEAEDFNEVLGEANNLSSLSFTTNIGLGLNYSFSNKLMFNIEPMFKYQLNPYTDSSVDYKPYYFGVYSGLSFKF